MTIYRTWTPQQCIEYEELAAMLEYYGATRQDAERQAERETELATGATKPKPYDFGKLFKEACK